METMDFIEKLKKIKNIKIYPSKANFILVELLGDIKSDVFVADMLINYGIYLRTCSDKIGLEGEYIRLASRNKSENDYIISCFEATFNK
jgi:histidinol-phosphate/aromatic aminotransferase/cobyric acid decarboxylase-like protein